MLVETEFGLFEMVKNHRDAFDLLKFQERYVKVAFDRYTFLVGDMSSGMLRIKGFNQDPKSTNGFRRIPDYLNESCNFNCPYYILKRVKDKSEDLID